MCSVMFDPVLELTSQCLDSILAFGITNAFLSKVYLIRSQTLCLSCRFGNSSFPVTPFSIHMLKYPLQLMISWN